MMRAVEVVLWLVVGWGLMSLPLWWPSATKREADDRPTGPLDAAEWAPLPADYVPLPPLTDEERAAKWAVVTRQWLDRRQRTESTERNMEASPW